MAAWWSWRRVIACAPLFTLLLGAAVFREEAITRRVVVAVLVVVPSVALIGVRGSAPWGDRSSRFTNGLHRGDACVAPYRLPALFRALHAFRRA